jgi:hypothetical protein
VTVTSLSLVTGVSAFARRRPPVGARRSISMSLRDAYFPWLRGAPGPLSVLISMVRTMAQRHGTPSRYAYSMGPERMGAD